jgi:hypothetical protein
MAHKLWEKNFEVNKEIERFTVGRDRELDLYLAKYDVLGSMAHITMLESIGLLEKDELTQLLAELKNIYAIAEKGEFVIEDGVEDVHSQVELMLTQKLGDMGKKIHSGRSRNDQVLVDLKLFTRHELKEIVDAVKILFDELIQKSNQYKNVLMPGYTHLQVAMPSSFGLWFGAYAEGLADDMLFLQAACRNQILYNNNLSLRIELTFDEVLHTVILWFRTNVNERQVQFVCHQCTLCDSASSYTCNSVSLWELLQDGVYEFELHIVAEFWEREGLAVVTIERRLPTRSPSERIVRLQFDSLNLQ